jgi:hypothetical protein
MKKVEEPVWTRLSMFPPCSTSRHEGTTGHPLIDVLSITSRVRFDWLSWTRVGPLRCSDEVHTPNLCIRLCQEANFLGASNPLCFSSSSANYFPSILFLSTTLSSRMTGISLHMQWPLTSQLHGSTFYAKSTLINFTFMASVLSNIKDQE